MQTSRIVLVRRFPALVRSAVVLSSLVAQAVAQSPTAPTAAVPAGVIDQQWQRATSKYDAKRAAILKEVDRKGPELKYTDDWATLAKVPEPEWYKDAKFGIFIHWGLYSVPGFGSEWYPREMYIQGSEINKHHVATFGPLDKFGYKDFIPMFKAEHYDPQAWAHLFHEAGAKYVVPVFEHHDGFQMYDSDLSDWTAAKMGPHRDLAGDLAKAVRAEGMHLGASSHRIEHNWFLDNGRKEASDVNDPKYAAFYGPAHPRVEAPGAHDDMLQDFTYITPAYMNDWVARTAEIVDKYHPDLIWFDWWIGQPMVRPYLAKFAAYYYNESAKRGDAGVINYKFHAMQEGAGSLDIERGQLDETRKLYWQTDSSVGNKSWGYIDHDTFKKPEFIVTQLVDIVSKNGNLLMNIGPRPDGTIPDEVQQSLLSVGKWLKVNGEAIYGTRAWKLYGEGPTKVASGSFHDTDTKGYTAEDFRFTAKGPVVYAIELGWPTGGSTTIHSLGSTVLGGAKVQSVSLLGSNETVAFEQRAHGLVLKLPAKPPTEYAHSFKIVTNSGAVAAATK